MNNKHQVLSLYRTYCEEHGYMTVDEYAQVGADSNDEFMNDLSDKLRARKQIADVIESCHELIELFTQKQRLIDGTEVLGSTWKVAEDPSVRQDCLITERKFQENASTIQGCIEGLLQVLKEKNDQSPMKTSAPDFPPSH